MKSANFFQALIVICCILKLCSATSSESLNSEIENVRSQLLEQGRTLVHHSVKRFMIILPAIFFKLGIAFTLLILVTLASMGNGVIGFLLLVVGLSSVLAKLQEPRRPGFPVQSYVNPLPPYQVWDRNDLNGKPYDTKMTSYFPKYS